MLKPKKKITKKEIKQDPLLETTYKAQTYYKKNRTAIFRIAAVAAVVLIVAFVLIERNRTINMDARTAFGKALVAFMSNDLSNARLQFEFVNDEYSGNQHGKLAMYYLGQILYDQNDLPMAETYLTDFVSGSPVDLLTSNAYTMLADINEQAADIETAIKMSTNAVKSASSKGDQVGKQLALAKLYLRNDQIDAADKLVKQIMVDEALPAAIKKRVEELSGQLLALE